MAGEVDVDAVEEIQRWLQLLSLLVLGPAVGVAVVEIRCGIIRGGSWPAPVKGRRCHPVLMPLLGFRPGVHWTAEGREPAEETSSEGRGWGLRGEMQSASGETRRGLGRQRRGLGGVRAHQDEGE